MNSFAKLTIVSLGAAAIYAGAASTYSASLEYSQLRRLMSPTTAELEREAQGWVQIYDGFKDYQVQAALDKNFDRMQSMMFTRILVTDKAGSALRNVHKLG